MYVDTSVLVPYYCPEPASNYAQDFLSQQSEPLISWLTQVEFASAIARKVREGILTLDKGHEVRSLFQGHLTAPYYRLIGVAYAHYISAWELLDRPALGLRSLDALHLGIVTTETLVLVTRDVVLARAAITNGIEVIQVGPCRDNGKSRWQDGTR